MVQRPGRAGWGVGGIEAEAAMLGQPAAAAGRRFRPSGDLAPGATATDLVLRVVEMLREKGVVGKFVEFFGSGLAVAQPRRPRDAREHGARVRRDVRHLPDRRADARLSPPHGPERGRRSRSSRRTRRSRASSTPPTRPRRTTPTRSSSTSRPSSRRIAGPKRPQDRIALTRREGRVGEDAEGPLGDGAEPAGRRPRPRQRRHRGDHVLHEHLEPLGDARRRPPRARRPSRRASRRSRGSRRVSRPARRS